VGAASDVVAISSPAGQGDARPADNDGPASRRVSLGLLARWAAVCVAPALYLVFVWHYGMNTLKGDDWVFVPLVDVAQHGHLTLGILWAQYNESHMLIPKLLWIIFGLTTHTDTKSIMLFDALLFTASYAFLLVVYRRTAGSWLGPIQVIVVGLVWFSLADWENALWGFQMAWYLSLFFFMAMLLVLSRREITRLGLTAAVVFAAAASLCTVQGLLVWPVGLLCILWRVEGRGRWISLGGPWVAGGVSTFGSTTLTQQPGELESELQSSNPPR
jgi:hypothetical protein